MKFHPQPAATLHPPAVADLVSRHTSRHVKAACLLTIFVVVLTGCDEKAPATNRLLHDPPIDLAYLHDVFIPSYDAGSRAKLIRSVAHLEVCLAEFQAFMHDVEQGKIAVRQNFKSGYWQSVIEKPDSWIVAEYADKLGPVIGFQKHQNKNPATMIYHFNFNTAGYIERADMPLEGFSFDEKGRLRRWHGENEPYQIGLTSRCRERLAALTSSFR